MVRIVEDTGSRSATIKRIGLRDRSRATVKFKVFGTTSDAEVHAAAVAYFNDNLTTEAGGHTFLIDNYDLTHLGGDAWELTGNYESLGTEDLENNTPIAPDPENQEQEEQRGEPLKRTRQFDTSGGKFTMTQALDVRGGAGGEMEKGERRYAKEGETAPDMEGVIGWDGQQINGVEVIAPAFQWTETYDIPARFVTGGYIRRLGLLTGTTNKSGFRGFARCEVLFAGASGQQQWDSNKGDGPWSLSYKFIASSGAGTGYGTRPALQIGDISGIKKGGWQYLWIWYGDDTSGNQRVPIKRPKYVYVNSVYREADFSRLGIGN